MYTIGAGTSAVTLTHQLLYTRNDNVVTVYMRADITLINGATAATFTITLPSVAALSPMFTTDLSGVQTSPTAHALVHVVANATMGNATLSLRYSDATAFNSPSDTAVVAVSGYLSYTE